MAIKIDNRPIDFWILCHTKADVEDAWKIAEHFKDNLANLVEGALYTHVVIYRVTPDQFVTLKSMVDEKSRNEIGQPPAASRQFLEVAPH